MATSMNPAETPIGSREDAHDDRSPHAQIVDLARGACSPHAFFRQALTTIAHAFGSPFGALYVRLDSEVVEDECHAGSSDPAFWQAHVREFLTDSLAADRACAKLLSARRADLQVALISAPILGRQGSKIGALALVARATASDINECVARLESLTALASHAAELIGSTAAHESGEAAGGAAKSLARAATTESPEELAYSLTNGLRNKLDCEQVALAWVTGRRVRLLSISGFDDIKRQSPGVVRLRAAMEECLDRGEPIVYERERGWSGDGRQGAYRLHKQWHEASGGAAVASIPLRANGCTTAILSLRKRPDEPLSVERIEQIRKTVEPYAAALRLLVRARRGVVRHARDAAFEWAHRLVRPGCWGRKLMMLLAAASVLWCAFGSLEYEITAPCVVTPTRSRHLSTPFDAVIASASVVAGDRVRAGQILCELDHRDLDLERGELSAQLAVLEQEQLRALADKELVEVRLAEANERLVRARLAQVDRRIEQARIRSPFDGLVVSGDLRKRLGGVVQRGETLFEVAPLQDLSLELEIPESAAAHLSGELRGRFAGRARPEQVQPFRVVRVRPSAEVRDGRNVFVVEAEADLDADWVRPGMEGIAKVSIGPRPVWWVLVHRAIDYMHLNYWL